MRKLLSAASAAILLTALTAACGHDEDLGSRSGTVATSTAASAPSGAPDLGAPEELARGIDVPWGVAFLPGGQSLGVEHAREGPAAVWFDERATADPDVGVADQIVGGQDCGPVREKEFEDAVQLLAAARVPAQRRRLLQAMDPRLLAAAIGVWLAERGIATTSAAGRAIAVDGKTLRGSRTTDTSARHVMTACDQATGVVLASIDVDGKTNEITRFASLLDQISDLRDTVVTADALHCQREHVSHRRIYDRDHLYQGL
ncbi:ISAs1 family transposase [Micromonospora ureilytica]|uniref:ISAs1 family transposase n=1 Tax=Micromonospora ureilytica TaxID=709868 RepID=UPI00403A3194